MFLLVSCGAATDSSSTTNPGPQTSSSEADPTSTTAGGTQSEFPIPVMDGGVTESAFATEVTVLYPETSFDQLIDFYDDYSDSNGGTAFELFVGREWQVQGALIRVTPVDQATHPDRPAGTVLFIRLP